MIGRERLIPLLEKAGALMTGRPVKLRLRTPAVRGARGQMTPTVQGGACIDIAPELSEQEFWRTYLHELAHVALHWIPVKADFTTAPAASLPFPESNQATRREELEADRLALYWELESERFARYGGDWLLNQVEGLIKALDKVTNER